MPDKELNGVPETQPEVPDKQDLFDETDFEDLFKEPEETEKPEKETTETTEATETNETTEAGQDKTAQWDRDEAIKAYKNAEKKLGSMGQEIGELRKQVEAITKSKENKVYTMDNIPEMDDLTLDTYLNTYKIQLKDADILTDTEMYNQLMLEYQALNTEKAIRLAKQRINQEQEIVKLNNLQEKVKNEFNLSDDEAKQLVNLAKRLDSNPGSRDLAAAFLKLYPDRFYQWSATRNKEKLEKAKTAVPRIPNTSSSPTPKKVTVKEYLEMTEEQREQFAQNASLEELDALQKELKKT